MQGKVDWFSSCFLDWDYIDAVAHIVLAFSVASGADLQVGYACR